MWLYDPRTNTLDEIKVWDNKKKMERPATAKQFAERFAYDVSTIRKSIKRRGFLTKIGCYIFTEKPPLEVRRALYEKQVFHGELWRKHDASGLLVSNHGRIKQPNGQLVLPAPKKPSMHRYVQINEAGQRKCFNVRNLVAECFIGPLKPGMCVGYRTVDKADCSVWNLKYENMVDVQRRALRNAKAVVLVDEQTLETVECYRSIKEALQDSFFSNAESIIARCNGKIKERTDGWYMWEEDYNRMMDELECDKAI